MPDELNLAPCPWCKGTDTLVFYDYDEDDVLQHISVCCSCGAKGPNFGNEEDAIAAWNALPRAQQWTEYDGKESTLPKAFDFVLVESEYMGIPTARRTLRRYDENGIEILGEPLEIGNRWLPWPGDAQ